MNTTFLAQIVARIASENPRFHKRLSQWTIILAALAGAALWFVNEAPFEVANREFWSKLLTVLTSLFSGASLTAQTGTTNPDLIDPKVKENVVEEVLTP